MSASISKSLLIMSRKAPHGSARAAEALDAAFAAAAFNQQSAILFMDDGVFQLLLEQKTSGINQKNPFAALGLASLYGIEKLYADKSSLQRRNISVDDLAVPVVQLESHEVAELIRKYDALLSF